VVPADSIATEEDLDYLNDMYSISVAEQEASNPANDVTQEAVG